MKTLNQREILLYSEGTESIICRNFSLYTIASK